MINVRIIKGGEGSGHHDHAGRPGKVGGSAPSGVTVTEREGIMPYVSEVFDNKVAEFVDKYADDDIERLSLITPMGREHTAVGDKDSVDIDFTPMEAIMVNNGLMVHNHPMGVSFSPEDVAFAARLRLKEIVAVGVRPSDGKKVKYTLQRNGVDWGFGWKDTVVFMQPIFKSIDNAKYLRDIKEDGVLADYYAWNEIWTKFASATGHAYIEEEV